MSNLFLEDRLLSHLIKYGWHRERNCDINNVVAELSSNGVKVFSLANDILSGFYKLSVPSVVNNVVEFAPHEFYFDPIEAFEQESDRYSAWEDDMSIEVCPLGIYGHDTSLIVTADDCYYLNHSYDLWLIGNSFNEAMCQLIFGSLYPTWHSPMFFRR